MEEKNKRRLPRDNLYLYLKMQFKEEVGGVGEGELDRMVQENIYLSELIDRTVHGCKRSPNRVCMLSMDEMMIDQEQQLQLE
ncbi:unnamed protein product [Sphenostylis stenocarpa]|uniref:Uncharacterized protein n=1 Tax=Sphenostylis stenocarpa TaxID=92480 RepID=A0AA86SDD0_9FABA|nr:unnamed protein product [Sphenostylis stenocarpa]